MSNSLKILEDRIADLEKKVCGSMPASAIEEAASGPSVIEKLLNTNALISSAISGRENLTAIINRLPELSNYLDSSSEYCDVSIDAKLEYILASESQMKENLRLLTEMKKLQPVIEMDSMREAPELSKKLNSLTLNYLKMNENSEALNGEIHNLFKNYNAIINSISKSLIAMDATITKAEIDAMPKKQLD